MATVKSLSPTVSLQHIITVLIPYGSPGNKFTIIYPKPSSMWPKRPTLSNCIIIIIETHIRNLP